MPRSIKTQKDSGTILFRFSAKKGELRSTNKPLKDYQVIKPGIGEKILLVQRKHPIALFTALGQQFFLVASVFAVLSFIAFFLQNTFSFEVYEWVALSYLAIAAISTLLVSFIYIFMHWYYEFYIITNRSILHRFSFRLAGPFSEIVYGDRMTLREVIRQPQNLIYDFLKIEDVHVYFQKQEQEEPFIFETPTDAQEIEDLIHDISIMNKREKAVLEI